MSISYLLLLLFFFSGLGTFWVAIGHLVGSRQNQAFPAHFLWLEQQPSGTDGRGFDDPEELELLLGFPPLGGLEDLTADTSAAPAAFGELAVTGATIAATLAAMSVV